MPKPVAIRTDRLGRIYKLKPSRKQKRGLLTVQENLWMFAQFYGLDYKTTDRRIGELLGLVGLADRKSTKISDLSTARQPSSKRRSTR